MDLDEIVNEVLGPEKPARDDAAREQREAREETWWQAWHLRGQFSRSQVVALIRAMRGHRS